MVFTEGKQVARALASVAVAWKIRGDRSTGRGFLAQVLLDNVVGVDSVALTESEVEVRRALIQGNVCDGATGEASKRVWLARDVVRSILLTLRVCLGNQADQVSDGWRSARRSGRSPFHVAGNRAGNGDGLMLADSLVGEEE